MPHVKNNLTQSSKLAYDARQKKQLTQSNTYRYVARQKNQLQVHNKQIAPSPATQRRVPLHHTKQLPSTNITRKQCPPAIVFPTVFSYKSFPASEM